MERLRGVGCRPGALFFRHARYMRLPQRFQRRWKPSRAISPITRRKEGGRFMYKHQSWCVTTQVVRSQESESRINTQKTTSDRFLGFCFIRLAGHGEKDILE